MSDPQPSQGNWHPSEELSTLFAHLVIQQSNMALMLLGKVAHPETGKAMLDVEAAKLFIDQLEMLEVKTKGNLTKEEEALLKQSLMTLRLAFVEAVESQPPRGSQAPPQSPPSEPRPASAAQEQAPPAEEEHKKKFSKKY